MADESNTLKNLEEALVHAQARNFPEAEIKYLKAMYHGESPIDSDLRSRVEEELAHAALDTARMYIEDPSHVDYFSDYATLYARECGINLEEQIIKIKEECLEAAFENIMSRMERLQVFDEYLYQKLERYGKMWNYDIDEMKIDIGMKRLETGEQCYRNAEELAEKQAIPQMIKEELMEAGNCLGDKFDVDRAERIILAGQEGYLKQMREYAEQGRYSDPLEQFMRKYSEEFNLPVPEQELENIKKTAMQHMMDPPQSF